jgi:hypothetical protein
MAGPEEPFQPILLAPGDNVNVQVGYALADPVIDRNEGAFRRQSFFNSSGHQFGIGEQRTNDFRRKIEHGLIVMLRNQKAVPWKERPMIKEDKRYFIFKNPVTFQFPANNPAKFACSGHLCTFL